MSMKRLHTYKAYTAGCVIAWAIAWIVLGVRSSEATREHVLYGHSEQMALAPG
jgi:hypothetical protein